MSSPVEAFIFMFFDFFFNISEYKIQKIANHIKKERDQMNEKKNPRLTARDEDGNPSSAYFYDSTVSANECTGMTPTLVNDSAAAKSYLDLLGVPVTSADGASKHKKIFPEKAQKSTSKIK